MVSRDGRQQANFSRLVIATIHRKEVEKGRRKMEKRRNGEKCDIETGSYRKKKNYIIRDLSGDTSEEKIEKLRGIYSPAGVKRALKR